MAGYQVLTQGLAADTQAVALEPGGDGLDQMATVLRGRHGLAAIHLVSHGAPGALELGTTALDAKALATHAADVQALAAVGLSTGTSFVTSRWGQWDATVSWRDVGAGVFG